jgi:hypothetical protein
VTLVLSRADVKDTTTSSAYLGHLASSKDFRLDFNLSGAYWFYHHENYKKNPLNPD